MEALIIQTFQEPCRRCGVRRQVAELKARGLCVGKHRVQHVLRHNGLKAIQPHRFVPRTPREQTSLSHQP